MEISKNTQDKPTVNFSNKYGDKNILSFPLRVEGTPTFQIVESKLQGFIGNGEGLVTEHHEDPGVIEMFFPISGQIEMTRGGETQILSGRFDNLLDIESSGELNISDGLDKSSLLVKTKSGEKVKIAGFIIPDETDHSTSMIPKIGEVCRYVSVKVKRTG